MFNRTVVEGVAMVTLSRDESLPVDGGRWLVETLVLSETPASRRTFRRKAQAVAFISETWAIHPREWE